MLDSFGALDVREYQKNKKPKDEALVYFFTFSRRGEAESFAKFASNKSKYESKGIGNCTLAFYYLQPGKQ